MALNPGRSGSKSGDSRSPRARNTRLRVVGNDSACCITGCHTRMVGQAGVQAGMQVVKSMFPAHSAILRP